MSEEEYSEKDYTNEPKVVGFSQPRINEVAQNFLSDLESERQRLGSSFPLCKLLIDEAFDKVYSTGRIPGKEYFADIYRQQPIKISQKVYIPVKQYPKFNFIGKILGPKGNSLKRLQKETKCQIMIKGRRSVGDRNKEDEMRNSGDPRFSHLNRNLFLEISTVSNPADAYARIACGLTEVRKYIVPDNNDEVSRDQYRELEKIERKTDNRSTFKKNLSGEFPSVSTHMNPFSTDTNNGTNSEVEAFEEPTFSGNISKRQTEPVYAYAEDNNSANAGDKCHHFRSHSSIEWSSK